MSTVTTKGLTYSTVVPGLPGGPLLTDYPISLKLIPADRTYQRPGIKASKPRRSVQHGTGNPSSMAAGEITWLVDSRAGGGQVSFHATADDLGVWIGVPADEVTWQAADGSGPGNMNGFSCEMIENTTMWNNAARRERAIYVTADFMGRVSARLDIKVPEQHYTFNFADPNRHNCPDKLRHVAGAWDTYVKQWNASKADELKRMGGQVEPEKPTTKYPAPIPVPALAGISAAKNDEAPGVVTDEGTDYVFVADVVEAIKATPRLKTANKGADRVGPDIAKGERFVVSWLFKARDGRYYYLTPWNTRVLQADTTRIADAPFVTAA